MDRDVNEDHVLIIKINMQTVQVDFSYEEGLVHVQHKLITRVWF